MCKEIKLYSEFHKNSQSKDGYRSYCKKCRQEHRKNNKDKYQQREKEYYQKNREKRILKAKEYRDNNKTQINNKRRQKYRNDSGYKEKILERNKLWSTKNSSLIKLKNKKYYKEHKEELLNNNRKTYEKNKDKWKETRNIWRKNNIEKIYSLNHSRRVLERGLLRDFSSKDWINAIEYFDGKCAYCLREDVLTRDHFIPITKGGNHVKNNIVPVCKRCNFSKQDKEFNFWYEQQDFYSPKQKSKIFEYLKSVQ